MTIKEVEQLTGISKANIRFYESEGLITPERRDNGYRTYNDSHVDALKRIRLFRALEVPIDTIRELSGGTVTLADALASSKAQFADRHDQLVLAETVIDQILGNGEQYESVDADAYIRMLEREESPAMERDINPKLNLPWRRFWARMLDFALYNLILFLLVPGLYGDQVWSIVRFGLDLVLFVAAETFLLAWFGTTPGKAVFGISVTDLEGKRLSIRSALDRTMLVAQHGLGFNVPFLTQYKQWESLKALENGQELAWEQESEVNFRDAANWRYLLFLVLVIPMTFYPIQDGLQIETPKQEESHAESVMGIMSETEFYVMHNSYRVSEVVYSSIGQYGVEELPILILDDRVLHLSYTNSSIIDGADTIGTFVSVSSAENGDAMVWELMPSSGSEELYRLRLETDKIYLDYYENTQLQWSWQLVEAEILNVKLQSEHSKKSMHPIWWKPGTFDVKLMENYATHLRYPITMSLIFPEEAQITEITIREEFFVDGEMTVREHTAVSAADGMLTFSVSLPELDAECSSIFYIPYEGGEFIVCFTYEPGEEKWDAFIYAL